jgi:xylulokinase
MLGNTDNIQLYDYGEKGLKNKLIGIDIGTTGCKVSLFSLKGELLAHYREDYPTYTTVENASEQDPLDWWRTASSGMRDVLQKEAVFGGEIAAIGLSCMTPVLLPIDTMGNPLCRAHIWSDRRADNIVSELEQYYGKENFHKRTGNILKAGYLLPKLYWQMINQRHIYDAAVSYLQIDGYIALRLTGQRCMNKSHCELTGLNLLPSGSWLDEVISLFKLDPHKLPEITETGSVIGYTLDGLEKECGIPAGIPVVSGGHDSALSSFALGISKTGHVCLDIGNASNLVMCIDKTICCKEADFYRHPVQGIWLFQIYSATTGGAFRWLRNILNTLKPGTVDFPRLTKMAEAASPGCKGLIFLPYFCGSQFNDNSKAAWYGLMLDHGLNEMVRAVMEGCALSIRLNMETMEQASNVDIKTIIATGGGAIDEFWMQMHANILRRPLKVRPITNAAVFGAAMLARQTVLGIPYEPEFSEEKIFTPDRTYEDIYDNNFRLYKEYLVNVPKLRDKYQDHSI